LLPYGFFVSLRLWVWIDTKIYQLICPFRQMNNFAEQLGTECTFKYTRIDVDDAEEKKKGKDLGKEVYEMSFFSAFDDEYWI